MVVIVNRSRTPLKFYKSFRVDLQCLSLSLSDNRYLHALLYSDVARNDSAQFFSKTDNSGLFYFENSQAMNAKMEIYGAGRSTE